MFSMTLFHTHQSQTGVLIAEDCWVYSFWSYMHVASNVLYVTLPYALDSNRCAHCRRSAVCTFWTSCVQPPAASQRGAHCPASRWNFWDFYFSLSSSRFYFVKVTILFDLLSPGHLPPITGNMEAHPHLSAFCGWVALSQGELLSQICCSAPYKITLFCFEHFSWIMHFFRADNHHHLISPNFLLTG